MILPLIILGLLGWILLLIILYYRFFNKEEKESYKVIHLSALLDGRVIELFKSGLIEGIPIVSQMDMDALSESELLSNMIDERRSIINGIDEIGARIYEKDFIDICKDINCTAIIASDIENILEVQGIRCINIKDIDKAGKGKVYKNQKIIVKDVEYGYNKARGLLNDGTVVEIEGNIPKGKPLSLICRITSISEGQTYRKIWARWENE